MVKIQLPDGNFKEFEKNPNTLEVAASISERLAQDTIAGKA